MSIHAATYDLNINDDHKTMVSKINHNFHAVSRQTSTVETITSGSGGVESHQQLTGTENPNCHPEGAITGLSGHLTSLADKINTLDNNKADKKTVPTTYIDYMYPIHIVIPFHGTTLPTWMTKEMTWKEIGTNTIGTTTIHYFERTE